MSKMNSKTTSQTSLESINRRRLCLSGAWSLSALVSIIAIIAWGHDYNWHFIPLNAYQIFPVLGLLAFSLMWSHYMSSVLRQTLNLDKGVLKRYFETTSLAVLILICLHPSLLIYQRFRDGYGFPPHSYESYVAPGLGWVTLLGTVCFFIFISYELRRFYGTKPWWRYIAFASDAAMLGIFYHALRLGHQLHAGWFRDIWYFYGVTLVAALFYGYRKRYIVSRISPKLSKSQTQI